MKLDAPSTVSGSAYLQGVDIVERQRCVARRRVEWSISTC